MNATSELLRFLEGWKRDNPGWTQAEIHRAVQAWKAERGLP